ncbi:hypothetical protein GQ457_12G012360 [Hibiscus cannabinus]
MPMSRETVVPDSIQSQALKTMELERMCTAMDLSAECEFSGVRQVILEDKSVAISPINRGPQDRTKLVVVIEYGAAKKDFENSLPDKMCACVSRFRLQQGVEDRLVWKHDRVGNFSVQSLYRLCSLSGASILWFILVGRLPMLYMLRERGIPIATGEILCRWCGLEVDAADHILLHCTFAGVVWTLFLRWWQVELVVPKTICEFMHHYFYGFFTADLRSWWIVGCAAVLWRKYSLINVEEEGRS